VTVTEN